MNIANLQSLSAVSNLDSSNQTQALDAARSLLNKKSSKADENRLGEGKDEVKEAFQDFVGQTFFGQLISSMRTTQGEVPYFNGGQAEKIFQGQLDQVLTEKLSDASASKIADPMYKLFQMHRQ